MRERPHRHMNALPLLNASDAQLTPLPRTVIPGHAGEQPDVDPRVGDGGSLGIPPRFLFGGASCDVADEAERADLAYVDRGCREPGQMADYPPERRTAFEETRPRIDLVCVGHPV